MDSSLNKPSQIIEINSYVVNNLNLFDSILNSLESVSTEAKTFLKEKMSTDGRLDNKLWESSNMKGTALRGSKHTGLL